MAAVMLFTRIVDTENYTMFLRRAVKGQIYDKVIKMLGHYIQFRFNNPTGHYLLDLSKDTDRMLANTLQEVSHRSALVPLYLQYTRVIAT
eukprot:4750156-Pyramimonas_sp.AAC.2